LSTDTEFTIVVPDSGMMAAVCGTNDGNLRLMEDYLGVPVFTRGNEISVSSADSEIRRKFRFIIDRTIDEIRDGGENGEDIVLSVLNTGRCAAADMSVVVPGGLRRIYPRSDRQAEYIYLMRTKDVVFCTGSAGSGKTFLAVAEALRLLLTRAVGKIVMTRPAVEAGENLGFLPGDLEQKTDPYLRPLRDAMEFVLSPETVRRLFESGAVETAPLAYMRGRTLDNSVIILDEAQNTTHGQMKMFLTRMGGNSKVFITGDTTQTDLPRGTVSGLRDSIEILHNIGEIGFMELTAEDVVRSRIVRKIIRAYENEE